MKRRLKRWLFSRGSPDMTEIWRPTSEIKSNPDRLNGPSDHTSNGRKMCMTKRSLSILPVFELRSAAVLSSAALPAAIIDVRWIYRTLSTYGHPHLWTSSQAMYLPATHETNWAPSGRLPSLRRNPSKGSYELGISVFLEALQMIVEGVVSDTITWRLACGRATEFKRHFKL